MEYLSLIFTFIIGGGLTTLINFRLNKKAQEVANQSQKVDFADKAVKFMETQNDSLMERIVTLEEDVKKLFVFKCEKINCKDRVPPTPL